MVRLDSLVHAPLPQVSNASPVTLPLPSSWGASPSAAYPPGIPDLQDIQFSQFMAIIGHRFGMMTRLRTLLPLSFIRPPGLRIYAVPLFRLDSLTATPA